jgi:hypothetical protein
LHFWPDSFPAFAEKNQRVDPSPPERRR